jgi:hypothetical protein
MNRILKSRAAVTLTSASVTAGLLIFSPGAQTQDVSLRLEPAALIWVDQPQATRFKSGFAMAVRPSVSVGRVLSFQASWSMIATPEAEGPDLGISHAVMGGLRVRPFAPLYPPEEQLGGLFMDFNTGYVWTGDLGRLGFDAGFGYGYQFTNGFSLGPVVRYSHIVQPDDRAGRSPDDAQAILVGLDFGLGIRREPIAEKELAMECPDAVLCPAPARQAAPLVCPDASCPETDCADCATACPDADLDGVCDADDRCPMAAGPKLTVGCPVDPCNGEPLIVLVQFDFDSSDMPDQRTHAPQTMDPVLDAVADAIALDPSCRVCIIGHASEEGAVEHNQTLSEERAEAVQDYMTAKGVRESRIPTTAMGARCQIVPETSRPLNRRVEFKRLQDGESCPVECSP